MSSQSALEFVYESCEITFNNIRVTLFRCSSYFQQTNSQRFHCREIKVLVKYYEKIVFANN